MHNFNRLIKYNVVLLGLFLFGCSHVEVVDKPAAIKHHPPAWYGALEKTNNKIIGYGEGVDRPSAKEQALHDISSQLSVSVDSTINRRVEDVNGKITRQRSQNVRLKTQQKLDNAEVLKEQRLADGYTYIAYQLSLLELEEQIAEALLKSWDGFLPRKVIFKGVSWLSDSRFSRKLASHLESPTGTDIQNVTISLHRKHDSWVLSVNDISRIISQSELADLVAWQETTRQDFQLSLIKFDKDRGRNRLKQGDRFAIKLQSSDVEGYYTLFNIYPDGQLVAMKDSSKLARIQTFPDESQQKRGIILVAETLEKGKVSEDVLLAVKSDYPLDTTMFRQASSSKETQAHHLHKLLTWLEINNIKTVSILRVEIQPD